MNKLFASLRCFVIAIIVFATSALSAQVILPGPQRQQPSYQGYSAAPPQNDIKIMVAVDLNAPIGGFAKSDYQLSPGAENYKQEGSFKPAAGLRVGVEIPLSYSMSIRPTVGMVTYTGTHKVGDFDEPKMKLETVRVGVDGLFYMDGDNSGRTYGLVGISYDSEKLNVDRGAIQENFNAKRIAASVGIGRTFGGHSGPQFAIEASLHQTLSGEMSGPKDFPKMQAVRLSLAIHF